jgi:hypothetical protein
MKVPNVLKGKTQVELVHNRENKSLVIACNDQIVDIDQEKTGGLIILLNKERQIDHRDLKSNLQNSILES